MVLSTSSPKVVYSLKTSPTSPGSSIIKPGLFDRAVAILLRHSCLLKWILLSLVLQRYFRYQRPERSSNFCGHALIPSIASVCFPMLAPIGSQERQEETEHSWVYGVFFILGIPLVLHSRVGTTNNEPNGDMSAQSTEKIRAFSMPLIKAIPSKHQA